MEALTIDQESNAVEIALARATLYSALALGFRPPTGETLPRLTSEESIAALTDAAILLEGNPHPSPLPERARVSIFPSEQGALIAAVKCLAEAQPQSIEELQSSFYRLFGHTARGAVPPYETEYGNEALFQQPQELGDLMGFYRAFGLTVKPEEHERLDHISCELEFLCFLAMKEAYALKHEDAEMLEATSKAQKLFLKEHLGRFLPAFAAKLGREDCSGFYGALAQLCLWFVVRESLRLGVTLGGLNLTLRPAEDDRVPMACGSGAECAAMPGACAPEGSESV